MLFISHRGNTRGPEEERENQPQQIESVIQRAFDVEVDVWCIGGNGLYLGHDKPQYEVTFNWIKQYSANLWLHCKNIEALLFFKEDTKQNNFNYFWHEEDTITLTSSGYIWAYPGKQPIRGSIAVLPERNKDLIDFCTGVCSDYIENYKYDKSCII